MAFTGLRPSELCGLRVGSIHFTRRLVRVSEILLPVHSFGGSRYALVNGWPKTDAGDRDIPIPAWLCNDLAAMLAERSAGKPGSLRRSDYLFLRPTGLPLNLDKFRQEVIRPALRAAGLPETLRTYDIRHSHASLLIDVGANPLAVAHRWATLISRHVAGLWTPVCRGQEELTERLDNLRRGSALWGSRPGP